MTVLTRIPMLAPLLVLAACGSNDNDPGPGGVTAGEARALDDAATMLDARKPAPVADPHPDATDAMAGPSGTP